MKYKNKKVKAEDYQLYNITPAIFIIKAPDLLAFTTTDCFGVTVWLKHKRTSTEPLVKLTTHVFTYQPAKCFVYCHWQDDTPIAVPDPYLFWNCLKNIVGAYKPIPFPIRSMYMVISDANGQYLKVLIKR